MRRFVLVVLSYLFVCLSQLSAQDASLEVVCYVETSGGSSISGAKAELFEDGSRIKSASSDTKGKISFMLKYGKTYKILVTKSDMIQKRIDFQTNVPAEQQRNLKKEFAMTLVNSCKGADVTAFNEPVDIIKYDEGFGNFVSDQSHFEKMQAKFSQAYRNIDKCIEENFLEKKSQADKQFNAGNYEDAIDLYKEALEVKPNDNISKRQIAKAKKAIVEEQANQQRYEQLIKEADRFMDQNSLTVAKQKYTEASRLNPGSEYPREKINEITKIVAQQQAENLKRQAVENEYKGAMQQANAAMAAGNYALAEQMFEKASVAKPTDAFAKQKIAEARQAMVIQKQKDAENELINKQYQEKIAEASMAMQQQDYNKAQELYQAAIALKPSESLARQKLNEAQKLEAQQQQQLLAEQKAEVERQYSEAIAKADGLLAQKQYEEAKLAYEQARVIKPTDKYSQNQIVKIQNLVVEAEQAKQVAIEKQFTESMALGDQKKLSKEYGDAIAAYQSALQAKPNDPIAASKLAETQKLLADKDRLDKEERETRAKYTELIQQGDGLFAAEDYQGSKSKYQEALYLYSTEQYPKNQIAKIDNIVAKEEQLDKYNSIIAEADGLFNSKNWEEAKSKYGEASLVLPANPYPKQKINEINQNISNDAKAEIEKKYNELVAQAEQQVAQKNYDQAKTLYSQAQLVMPENPYPQQKINEISQLISDAAKAEVEKKYNELAAQAEAQIAQKNYGQAKTLYSQAQQVMPENPYPRQRINEINQLVSDEAKAEVEKIFNELAAQAEDQVTQKNFEHAKSLYAQAQQVMPENPFPQKRINEINQLISQNAKSAIEGEYNSIVNQAEEQITQKNYAQAKDLYARAQQVMPENTYPQQRINEINKMIDDEALQGKLATYNELIAKADIRFSNKDYPQAKNMYTEASKIMPTESYPKQKINEINLELSAQAKSAIEKEFNKLTSKAEEQVTQKNYDQAKLLLGQAMKVRPEDPYPQRRINEINRLISDQEKTATEEKYNSLTAKAEEQVAQKNYTQAKNLYAEAQKVFPENPYPQQRINEINKLIDEDALQEVRNKYNNLIAKADGLFGNKEYNEAKSIYSQALNVIPSENYPRQKINEINRIVSDNARQGVIDEYNKLIAQADQLFGQKKYNEASAAYGRAQAVIPEEQYPRQKQNEINAILIELASQQAASAEIDGRYKQTVALADKYFNDKNYQLAISEYRNAMRIKAEEPYPSQQIDKINRLIEEQQKLEANKLENERKFKENLALADQQFKARNYIDAKNSYQNALQFKPGDVHSTSQIKRIEQLLVEKQAVQEKEKQKQEQYKNLISNADKLYQANKLKDSRQGYLSALEVIPGQDYPRSQIRKIDEKLRIIAANQARTKTVVTPSSTTKTAVVATTTPVTGGKLASNKFTSESERQKYLDKLLTDYGEGVTKEVYSDNSGTTNRYIVIRNGQVKEFREIRFKWGGSQYSVNGKPTNSQYLKSQVRPRAGENFSEIKK